MRYRPRLANGELVPISWPIAIYRQINHLIWPLEDGVSRFVFLLDRAILICAFFLILLHNEADIHFLIANWENLDEVLAGVPTFLIGIETQLRGLNLALRKDKFKKLLQRFYADFYVTKDAHPRLHARIQNQLMPTRFIAIMYLMTLIRYVMVPVNNIIYHRRDNLVKQIHLFDETKLRNFIPLMTVNLWIALIVDTLIFGEPNMMGELMMHMNARFTLLRHELHYATNKIMAEGDSKHMAAKYRRVLIKVLRRNVVLNEFCQQLKTQYSFRIFILFALSAMELCAMGFKIYTNPSANITYICWGIAKLLELLAFGQLGSILYKTTEDLGLMYYSSDWEQIIYHSTNVKENVRLMKLLTIAIELNSKPFCLTGLKYFRVTLAAVLTIIQGAYSYFMFLISMR